MFSHKCFDKIDVLKKEDMTIDWLNSNAICINLVCPKGYESNWVGYECDKCGWFCWHFGSNGKATPKICNKWDYKNKYIIE